MSDLAASLHELGVFRASGIGFCVLGFRVLGLALRLHHENGRGFGSLRSGQKVRSDAVLLSGRSCNLLVLQEL